MHSNQHSSPLIPCTKFLLHSERDSQLAKLMSSKEGKVVVDLTAGIVGGWKETYQWIPIFGAFATVAMAFSAGANNLTAPVGLSPFLFSLFYFSSAIRAC